MPSTAEWARSIADLGFRSLRLDLDFDARQDSGHWPCEFEGEPAGFELERELLAEVEFDDDVRAEVLERAAGRDTMVSFVWHVSSGDYSAGLTAAAVLAKLTDGVWWDHESNTLLSADEALEQVRADSGDEDDDEAVPGRAARARATVDPIALRWNGGELTLGYLGRFRWRLRHADAVVEADDAEAAGAAALQRIFRGASPGREAAERTPIRISVGAERSVLVADARMINGWTHDCASYRNDIGVHENLAKFLPAFLSENVDAAWAAGIDPRRPPPLGQEFCFDSFANKADSEALCRRLAVALTQRLRESPYPYGAFDAAMRELKELGHDLWSWGDGEWGHDYVTRRPGAGLQITWTQSDGENAGDAVEVEFLGSGSGSH